MKTVVRNVVDTDGKRYEALAFVCPGCENEHGQGGLHMLPVNTTEHSPSWTWNHNREEPTLTPSILSTRSGGFVCHSYLRAGVFEFLSDCTHRYAGQHVPMPDLYEWVTELG